MKSASDGREIVDLQLLMKVYDNYEKASELLAKAHQELSKLREEFTSKRTTLKTGVGTDELLTKKGRQNQKSPVEGNEVKESNEKNPIIAFNNRTVTLRDKKRIIDTQIEEVKQDIKRADSIIELFESVKEPNVLITTIEQFKQGNLSPFEDKEIAQQFLEIVAAQSSPKASHDPVKVIAITGRNTLFGHKTTSEEHSSNNENDLDMRPRVI